MGDNDFTAGDPWGLPIEDSEEIELKAAPDDPGAGSSRADVEQDSEDEPEPAASVDEAGPSDDDAEQTDESAADLEDTFEEDSEWEPTGGAFTPTTGDDHDADAVTVDDATDEGGAWAPIEEQASAFGGADEGDGAGGEDSVEPIEDEYESRPPARTPLSQMIAAAQSVVSSVQGHQPGDAGESTEPEPSADQLSETGDDVAEDEGSDLADGTDKGPPLLAVSDASDDEDLPDELPSWMIVEPEAEAALPDLAVGEVGSDEATDDEPEFTPMDIEASIADLATPEAPEVPFSEDKFEMPGAVEPTREDDFRDVDMDSSPGVYSELHDLDDPDAEAESLLQEAAQAFGRSDEQEPTEIPDLEPAQDEDLDRYADALATNLVEPAEEPTEVPDLEPAQDEDLDRYADALTTNLDEPAVESWEATAADLTAGDAEDHLSDDELGAALAGLADTAGEDSPAGVKNAGPVAVGWWDTDTDDVEEIPFVDTTGEPEETSVEGETEEAGMVGWWEADVDVAASDDIDEPPAVTEEELDGFGGAGTDTTAESLEADDTLPLVEDSQPADPEPASLIDSPVAWGTQYRQAHQGWVEDDAGRSTWRPIVTSGQSVAGWDIDIYLGLVSGDVAIDPGPKEEIASEVAAAREGAVRHMLDEGLARGAHAIVGVTFTIEEVGGVVLVGSSGVAVTLRTPA